MPELTLPMPGGGKITIQSNDDKELFKKAAFWQSLPTECPIDGSAVRLEHRNPSDYDYYSVVSTGQVKYEFKLGQHQTGGTLFAKNQWTYFNPDATGQDGKKGAEIVVWEYGKLHADRIPQGNVRQVGARQQEAATGGPRGALSQDAPQGGGEPFSQPPSGGMTDEQRDYLARGLAWVNKQLEAAQVPANKRAAVISSALDTQVSDIMRITIPQLEELVGIHKEEPEFLALAWGTVQQQEANIPDFVEEPEFPPEPDLPF